MINNFLTVLIAIFILLLFSCKDDNNSGSYNFRECTDISDTITDDTSLIATINGTKWLYQLQNASPSAIALTGFDVVVIDYSSDGEESGAYTLAEINTIKDGGTREVFAYLSIGEAEEYRYYFNSSWIDDSNQPVSSAPCWLNKTNPDWEGNYKVQYWSEEWQQIIEGYLDKIISAGFDGVYLDIIDAYEYWADNGNGEGYSISEEAAAVRMINFIKRIALYARVTSGQTNFLIIPQNGEQILDYDTGVGLLDSNDYLSTISGIGIEDLYYDETISVDAAEIAERKSKLNIISASKEVLVVDYVDDDTRPILDGSIIDTFIDTAITDGYYPYAAKSDRELDEINSFTGSVNQP